MSKCDACGWDHGPSYLLCPKRDYGDGMPPLRVPEQQSALGQQQAAQGQMGMLDAVLRQQAVAQGGYQEVQGCLVPSLLTDQGRAYEELGRLRARVAELEADLNAARSVASHVGCMATIDTMAEDLRRKREECERLERALAHERGEKEAAISLMNDEALCNARLRRELGRAKR